MSGDILINVDSITFYDKSKFIKPFTNNIDDSGSYSSMTFYSKRQSQHSDDKDVLELYGDKDWAYLIVDAMIPLLEYGETVENEVRQYYEKEDKIDVIGLGKNEFRALDIVHRLRGIGDSLKMYRGVPVVRLNKDSGIYIYKYNNTSNNINF